MGAAAVPLAIAGGSLIGGLFNYLGSNQQADAAKNATTAQTNAMNNAIASELAMYAQNRADTLPWRNTGSAALSQLSNLMGIRPSITDTTLLNGSFNNNSGSFNNNSESLNKPALPAPLSEEQRTQLLTEEALTQRSRDIEQFKSLTNGFGFLNPDTHSTYYPQETPSGLVKAAAGVKAAVPNSLSFNPGGKINVSSMPPVVPTANPGTSSDFGMLTQQFQFNPSTDPSYQWRLKQGLDAIEKSAAARGGFFSGQTGIDLMQYGQGMASQEYQNAFNRNQIYNTDLFNRLSSLAGVGQTTTNQLASIGGQTAGQMSGNYQNMGNAQAQGLTNQGNAWANMYQGFNNNVQSGLGTALKYYYGA